VLGGAHEVRLTSLLTRPSSGWGRTDRQAAFTAMRHGANAIVGGEPVTERLAEHRWLAWFPRPVGPHHAVNVPSRAVAALPDLMPRLQLARAHLALHAWQAELLQAGANLARTRRGG